MKEYLKKTWYMYVIVFVLCFMLFLYEPLIMYLGNTSDFWFGMSVMFKMSLRLFLLVFIPLCCIFNIIYFLNKNNNKKIFNLCILVLFVVFICSYIQGNYLVGSLPLLDGEEIEWSNYTGDWIVSAILWLVVIIAVIFISKKVTISKMVKYIGYVGAVVFVMLSLSFVTVFLSNTDSLEKDFIPIVTDKNLNTYSKDKNFIIFLLDCVDSQAFMKRLNADKNFKDFLNDFTYYPDTMSGHPLTMESIPLILTGYSFKNEEDIAKWSTDAYKKSNLFDLVEKNNYELEVYEENLLYNDKSAVRIANVYNNADSQYNVYTGKFMKQELKYILFRYLPSFLKKYSGIEKMNFSATSLKKNDESTENYVLFNSANDEMYNNVLKNEIEKVDDDIFKFIHLEGSHPPYTHDKNFKAIANATYEDEIDNSLTLTKAYLNMLKENKVYDNSVIIIMADHGYKTSYNGNQRKNPIFLVKGIKENHKTMHTSNKPIHYIDLMDAYRDLFAGKKASELFKNIPDNRTRWFLAYQDNTKEVMIETETNGKAWEADKFSKTGNEYRKKK